MKSKNPNPSLSLFPPNFSSVNKTEQLTVGLLAPKLCVGTIVFSTP
ncbi:hypothetical protein BDD14_1232 [Edaphobacter modestus]|uniref:Uncharacterized protein n=1 Tax=Edaphobacter modestus TaxID=388466 RepID=A0A4Q7YQ73_9BACT|nr:hypothetical protein BDD14_1232 [Edaphobacter modestus]